MKRVTSWRREGRGNRSLVLWGIGILAVVGIAIALVPLVPRYFSLSGQTPEDVTDQRFLQDSGESVAGTLTEPDPGVEPAGTDRANLERYEAIVDSAGELTLGSAQFAAINDYFAANAGAGQVNVEFTVSIGAAVPRGIELPELPPRLAEALPDYRGDRFALVAGRLVIVEDESRRIVAIIPVAV